MKLHSDKMEEETHQNTSDLGSLETVLKSAEDAEEARVQEEHCQYLTVTTAGRKKWENCKCGGSRIAELTMPDLTLNERSEAEIVELNSSGLDIKRPDVDGIKSENICNSCRKDAYSSNQLGIHLHTGSVEVLSSPVSCTSLVSRITSVESLPPEILLKIFSFLHPVELCRHVARVCGQWHALAFDHSLWHKLDLSSVNVHITGFDICRIVRRVGSSIHQLNLHGLDSLTPAEMAFIAENCPQLTHLDLGFVSGVNSMMIHSILTSCQKIQYVNVEGCKDVHHEFVRVMVTVAGPELCRLNFSHCPLVDDSLLLLSANLPRIVALNIDGISWISNRTVQDLATRHKDSLQDLDLDGAELTDYAIAALMNCRQLTSLSVSFCELLSDVSLSHVKTLTCLRKLCLRKGVMFSSEGLRKFLASSSLASLAHLDLSECASLRDDGVQALMQCCGNSLQTLNLSWCWDVTDIGLTAIVDRCSHLVQLHLVGLHRLTGSCLDRVPEDMPCLKHLDLQQCNLIQDHLVEDVVRRKPDLVVINYYGEVFVHGQEE